MIAFHGDSNLKANYVARLKAHEVADEIIHGAYSGASNRRVGNSARTT